jgi:hypothetical protein
MNRNDTATMCALLKAAFPVWQTTPETIELYHAMLKDLDSEIVMRAVQNWILTSEKFPTIAGIRKACAVVAGVVPITAGEAWQEVRREMEHDGRKSFSDDDTTGLTRAVSNSLDWWFLRNGDTSVVTSQFIREYNRRAEMMTTEILSSASFEVGAQKVALPHSTVVKSLSA